MSTKAVQWIEFDNMHISDSKAGFLISSNWQATHIAFIIEGDSSAITNAICPSLSVNYGSVY